MHCAAATPSVDVDPVDGSVTPTGFKVDESSPQFSSTRALLINNVMRGIYVN